MFLHLRPPLFCSTVTVFLILNLLHHANSAAQNYTECEKPYACGNLTLSYPFSGNDRPEFCGHPGFNLSCEEDYSGSYSVITMKSQLKFRVLEIDQLDYRMRIARMDLWENPCSYQGFGNTSLDYEIFDFYHHVNRNLTMFFDCGQFAKQVPFIFNCSVNGELNSHNYYLSNSLFDEYLPGYEGAYWFYSCYNYSVTVPILDVHMEKLMSNGSSSLQKALNGGFDVKYNSTGEICWKCQDSNGLCVYDNAFLCIPTVRSGSGKKNWSMKLLIGIGAAGGGILFICASYYLLRRMSSSGKLTIPWNKTQGDKKVEEFLRHHRSLAPKRYKYSEIKKMTDSFQEKLGQGAYGAVFKGKSPNGRFVAVKVLNISKGNGEEFINEVASISKTSHVNVVTLLGFCLQGQKRALVYEFMPNGSLEKFILQGSKHLGWEKLYQVAVGIARGLEYLHRGCNTRILHFDIKPHNILLDEEFSPKISDFGLAKLSSSKESKVSMPQVRGTVGYIAPEVFNRNFGNVSHKSDVYSYGMMVIDMVGGRKNLDVGATNTSEIYFPEWIYRRLELGTEFQGLQGVITGEESEIVKKMILVGLWCIQTNPSDRPAITKVIEMLEGRIGDLEIPPKPFLNSPTRPTCQHSTSDSTLETDNCSQTMSSNV